MGDLRSTVIEGYAAFAPVSRELIREARRCFPGGDTRMSAHIAPYPLFVERAEGCRLHDADGHVLLASEPELVKRSCSIDGTRERMICASATWLRVGAA